MVIETPPACAHEGEQASRRYKPSSRFYSWFGPGFGPDSEFISIILRHKGNEEKVNSFNGFIDIDHTQSRSVVFSFSRSSDLRAQV